MNRTRLRWPLVGALIVLFAGCDDSVAPAGTPSTVTVHAYVDADGSGNRSDADPPIVGAVVELSPVNGAGSALTATTNAEGVATFTNVPPGSHRVRLSGEVPAGAVLATALEPVIVAPYRGTSVATEFRFVFNPGEIVGHLFRDNDGDGVYTPGVDTPAPGIPIELYAGTDMTAEPVATVTTDADGFFRFSVLRAGQYTYNFSPLPTMQIVGGATGPVMVEPATATNMPMRWTGSLIVPIAEARQSAGSIVAVEGIVTAGVGIFSTNANSNQFNVQDATGGVLVLQVPLAAGIQTGDSVRVVGTAQVSAGELVLTSNPTVTVLASSRPLPPPVVVPATQIAASTAADPLQGSLVTVPNVRIDSVGAGGGGYNVFVTGLGGGSFIMRVSTQAIAPQSHWEVGSVVNITGALANFNAPQVKIRSTADVTTGSAFPTILEVRQGGAGQTVTFEGVVTAGVGVFSTNATSNQFNVQDETGGVLVLQVPLASGIALGDSVRVTGTTQVSAGEFVVTGNPTVVRLAAGRPIQPPVTVTAQHVAASTAADPLQGRLVRVENVTVTAVGAGAGGYNVTAQGADGGTFIIRVSLQSIATQSDWQVGQAYDIVGALANFNGAQVKIRSAADFAPAGTLPLAIGQARLQPAGTTVTVTGIVTAGVGVFSTNATSNQFNVQDRTGGFLVLQVPLASGPATGDSVRVTGTLSVSGGELLLTSNPTVTVLASNRPLPEPVTISAAYAAASTAADPLQGTIVRVENVTVTQVGAGGGGYNVTVTGASGATFIVRVSLQSIAPQSFWNVGATYHITGTLAQFNAAQVKVRSAADIVAVGSGVMAPSSSQSAPARGRAER